jgi:hypothetical protein
MFDQIRKSVLDRFKDLTSSPTATLFNVSVDRDKIWEIYLNAIPEEFRQSNNCNCCKSFLRQYAGIVAIVNSEKKTLWDFDTDDEELSEAIKAVRRYIKSLPITGLFLNSFARLGTEKNPDRVRDVIWTHYYLDLPARFIMPEARIGPYNGKAVDDKNVLKRSLEEITDDAVDTVIELINQGSLYRGNEFLPQVTDLRDLKKKYKPVPDHLKDNFCWVMSQSSSSSVSRIRNSAIGTLLVNLSEGMDINIAARAYTKVVDPTNYHRPKSIATPKMIDAAKARLEELGLVNAVLNRSQLSDTRLTVANALFVHRETTKALDVFDQAKQVTTVNPKTFSKTEE